MLFRGFKASTSLLHFRFKGFFPVVCSEGMGFSKGSKLQPGGVVRYRECTLFKW